MSQAQKTILVAAANVGSLGTDAANPSAANTAVRKNLVDTISRIGRDFGPLAALCVQEVGNFETRLPPYFLSPPQHHDGHVRYGADSGGRRGVAIYAATEASTASQIDDKNELCGTTVSYINAKRKIVKIALVCIYRNQHGTFKRTISETKDAILKMAHQLLNDGAANAVIMGDFNCSNIAFPGFREIIHPELMHQHNAASAPTRIDKIFVSQHFQNCGILTVYPSVENLQPTFENRNLGHRVPLIYIGRDPRVAAADEKIEIVSMKKVKKAAKNIDTNSLPSHKVNEHCSKYTNKMAEALNQLIADVFRSCRVKISKKKMSNNFILVDALERQADASAGKADRWNDLYRFHALVKGGLEEKITDAPKITEHAEKLELKLRELYIADQRLSAEIADKLYPVRHDVRAQWVENKKAFKKLVLSTSNSGAKDDADISLKLLRAVLARSAAVRDYLQQVCRRCLKIGLVPDVWKQDLLYPLYKRSGKTSDAKNWRPITIQPSFGKVLSKVFMQLIKNYQDGNTENHAYVAKRSCVTAIVDVQLGLLQENNPHDLQKSDCPNDLFDVFIESLDDISSAFESVEHPFICRALGNTFAGDREFNIPGYAASYLQRNSTVLDRVTGQKVTLKKTHKLKSTPQGSQSSPLFWRTFDRGFNYLFHLMMDNLITKGATKIQSYKCTNFADDHKTRLRLRLQKTLGMLEICAEIKLALTVVRKLIMKATELMGCSVNPKKSENIIPAKYHGTMLLLDERFVVKDTYKWLGYFLTLTGDGQLKYEVKSIEKRFIAVCNTRDDIFQYSRNISLRFKVYQTFLAPFVELYLPLVVQSMEHQKTAVHRFQADCLSKAAQVAYTAKAETIEGWFRELSVQDKTVRMAARISKACGTLEVQAELLLKHPPQQQRVLRGRSEIPQLGDAHLRQAITGPTAARSNFIFRLNLLSSFPAPPVVSSRKLDFRLIQKKARTLNAVIRKKIADRAMQNDPAEDSDPN